MSKTLRDSGHHSQDFIVWESDGNVCRENGVLAEGQVCQGGTVLQGPLTALEVYDGNGPATCVLLNGIDATDEDKQCAVLSRGPCELIEGQLVFESGTTNQHKLDAYADLKALGMIVRPTLGSETTNFTYPQAGL